MSRLSKLSGSKIWGLLNVSFWVICFTSSFTLELLVGETSFDALLFTDFAFGACYIFFILKFGLKWEFSVKWTFQNLKLSTISQKAVLMTPNKDSYSRIDLREKQKVWDSASRSTLQNDVNWCYLSFSIGNRIAHSFSLLVRQKLTSPRWTQFSVNLIYKWMKLKEASLFSKPKTKIWARKFANNVFRWLRESTIIVRLPRQPIRSSTVDSQSPTKLKTSK